MNNNQPALHEGRISIVDIVQLYVALSQVTDKSENLRQILTRLERPILEFTASLGALQ